MEGYNLNDQDFLSEVKRYDLYRGKELGRLFIDVHRIIVGDQHCETGKYMAVPTLELMPTKQEYIAIEETENEALRKCLDMIKGVPWKEIEDKAEQ